MRAGRGRNSLLRGVCCVAAARTARSVGMVGAGLDSLVRAASVAASRVPSATRVGRRPVSMAACAVQVARDVHGDLSRISALLVVGGEMGELVADQMRGAGLARLTVAARSAARRAAAAGGSWRPRACPSW